MAASYLRRVAGVAQAQPALQPLLTWPRAIEPVAQLPSAAVPVRHRDNDVTAATDAGPAPARRESSLREVMPTAPGTPPSADAPPPPLVRPPTQRHADPPSGEATRASVRRASADATTASSRRGTRTLAATGPAATVRRRRRGPEAQQVRDRSTLPDDGTGAAVEPGAAATTPPDATLPPARTVSPPAEPAPRRGGRGPSAALDDARPADRRPDGDATGAPWASPRPGRTQPRRHDERETVVRVGTIEVIVEGPPPVPATDEPTAMALPVEPASTAALSRGYRSTFGLRQG